MLLTALALVLAAQAPTGAAPQPPAAAPAASRQVRTAEIVGDLYLPASGRTPAPAILLLGGSEGGLGRGGARQAAALAAQGYAVLHLSYFGGPGQGRVLKEIPVETFTRALDWLKTQPEVDPTRIGIVGTSKGAEAALLVASRRPDLRIAVLGVPSSVVWPGIDQSSMDPGSSWTEGGQPVAFTPYGWSGEFRGIHALYADGLADPANGARGAIPAERAGASILMVCGEADQLWPSCPMARAVEARLRAAGYAHPVTLLAYPDAGHAAFGLPIDATPPPPSIAQMGGTVEGNVGARADGWPRVVAALDAALKGDAR